MGGNGTAFDSSTLLNVRFSSFKGKAPAGLQSPAGGRNNVLHPHLHGFQLGALVLPGRHFYQGGGTFPSSLFFPFACGLGFGAGVFFMWARICLTTAVRERSGWKACIACVRGAGLE